MPDQLLAPAVTGDRHGVGSGRHGSRVCHRAVVVGSVRGAGARPGHPFDLLYTYGFRQLVGGPPLPRYRSRAGLPAHSRQCMLIGAAWSFQTGRPLLGQILGWSLVAAAFVNVSTGFCIPSFIYGLLFGKPSSCDPVR